MIAEFVLFVKRVAGEFFPVSKDVVSAGAFRLDAQSAHGADDNIQLAPYVVVFFLYQEGEVDVPQIVIDGSAAGKSAHQMSAAFFQLGQVTFFPWVLIAADNDGMLILPEVEDAFGLAAVEHQVFLHGKIGIGIIGGAFNVVDSIDHEY